jgi:hypothetical protein
MNIFLYNDDHSESGVSSVIDYAISVKKPLAISNSHWFRHVYSDEICVNKKNIHEIFINSQKYVNEICNKFKNTNLIDKIDNIITKHLKP